MSLVLLRTCYRTIGRWPRRTDEYGSAASGPIAGSPTAAPRPALAAMDDLLSFPKRTRMPNLLLVGPTNNGKTMIVEKFRRAHPPIEARATAEGAANVPVLKVQMPAGPDEPRFFAAILNELGFPHRYVDRLAPSARTLAVRMLRETGVRILVIDEVHNLLSGSRVQQRRLLNLLRWLGNELQIPLVAVGTAEALHAVQSDDQLANRFEPIGLPPWRHGPEYPAPEYAGGGVSAARTIRPGGRRAFAQKLPECSLRASSARSSNLVTTAAVAAVAGREKSASAIERIDDIGFIPPTERRRVAG